MAKVDLHGVLSGIDNETLRQVTKVGKALADMTVIPDDAKRRLLDNVWREVLAVERHSPNATMGS